METAHMHVRKAAPHAPGMAQHGLMAYHTAYLLYCMCLRQGRVRLLDQGREVFPLTQCLDLKPQKQHLRHRLRGCDRVSVHVVWCGVVCK